MSLMKFSQLVLQGILNSYWLLANLPPDQLAMHNCSEIQIMYGGTPLWWPPLGNEILERVALSDQGLVHLRLSEVAFTEKWSHDALYNVEYVKMWWACMMSDRTQSSHDHFLYTYIMHKGYKLLKLESWPLIDIDHCTCFRKPAH